MLFFYLEQVYFSTKFDGVENAVLDKPAWTAQADPRQQFTQMSECPFSRVASHMMASNFAWYYALCPFIPQNDSFISTHSFFLFLPITR